MHAIFLLNLVNDLMEERNRLREEISELHEELCWHEEDEEEDGY